MRRPAQCDARSADDSTPQTHHTHTAAVRMHRASVARSMDALVLHVQTPGHGGRVCRWEFGSFASACSTTTRNVAPYRHECPSSQTTALSGTEKKPKKNTRSTSESLSLPGEGTGFRGRDRMLTGSERGAHDRGLLDGVQEVKAHGDTIGRVGNEALAQPVAVRQADHADRNAERLLEQFELLRLGDNSDDGRFVRRHE